MLRLTSDLVRTLHAAACLGRKRLRYSIGGSQGAVRDTVLVMPMGRIRLAFDADNRGRWAFHCHNPYHMMTGMMMEFRYEGIAA
jgi:FtsP/CotA-like multicopper oxidase with cupredoxin domain